MFHIKRNEIENPVLKQNVFSGIGKANVQMQTAGDVDAYKMNSWDVEYLTFPTLEALNLMEHLVSTRLGGVSEGELSTMNLSFTRGDRAENVAENYRRIGKILHCSPENMVASHQTHTTNIRRVTSADKGKGITVARDYEDIDGLITNESGIALVTYYADCVPLFFVDPVQKAIGLAHSGWRGTVNRMGRCMINAMKEQFGSNPADIYAAIGPSICQDCYEVSEDVAMAFAAEFPEEDSRVSMRRFVGNAMPCEQEGMNTDIVLPGKAPGKYQLNLWRANERIMLESGILKEHIAVTDICTCCNSEYLFSHRASGGRRGNIAAFLMLK